MSDDIFTLDKQGQRVTVPRLSPDLQRDLIEGLRAAVLKICPACQMKRPLDEDGIHRYPYGVTATCRAAAERALLARVDAEMAGKPEERKT